MDKLNNIEPKRVFKYFEELTAIPRGSGDMKKISQYCVSFAEKHNLRAIKDDADNVIIFKSATKGYEKSEPVILQGHLDMVCQKDEDKEIDFFEDSLDIYIDGDFIKAEGTTLGADNGIAVAMILAILESDELEHPPIEAIFTTDEEIGMIGASKLSLDSLKGKKLVNIDAEEPDVLTVSCAGGSEFKMSLELNREKKTGYKATISLKGLKGGHSGIEIDKGRVNANILSGRILNYLSDTIDFDIIDINGGDKTNAITNRCVIDLLVYSCDEFNKKATEYLDLVKGEISDREESFDYLLETEDKNTYDIISDDNKNKLIFILNSIPNGVMDMSVSIKDLVETSLNLGILKTSENEILFNLALRSNKKSALIYLEDKLKHYANYLGCGFETSGHYMPWEFKENSELQKLYNNTFKERMGYFPKTMAIHAGLECGVLSSKTDNLDCIAIGPKIYDAHTTNERLSISSTRDIFNIIVELLKKCK